MRKVSMMKAYFQRSKKNYQKKNNKLKLNKSVALTSRKKIMYKADFKSENYSILKLLGKGTYAKTYLVEDPKTKERFALKKITINDKIELKENKEEYNLILKLTKEFPELKIINIYGIEIKNLDKYNTVMYILMEAAKYDWEKEIMKHFDSGSYYKEDYLLNILYELVKSFAILQRKGICHRDVKPQNILCFPDDEYKISDFGEAKNFRKTMIMNNFNKNNLGDNTMEQTLRGTELYMSPILFQALRSRSNQFVTYNSYKSDVFSLGMCFFLASSLSYEGLYEIREILKNGNKTRLVVNRYLRKKYSQKYLNILIAMLQINERDRPDFVELEKMAENICNK
jgi:serine/threonine protein kinase